MSTRGVWGLRKDNKDKITYNHYDSYPTELGVIIKEFIIKHRASLNKIFDKIILVKENSIPDQQQIKDNKQYFEMVSTRNMNEWYALLRRTQKNPELYTKDLKYMIDNHKFIKDSLFCEWGYIINLDNNTLEIYRGFQKTPNNNRYKINKSKEGYYNCALIKEIPFEDLKDFSMETLEKEE